MRLVADALDRVETDPALKQADGMHPNARGARVMADEVEPFVAKALRGGSRN